jgi:hypothetical protein
MTGTYSAIINRPYFSVAFHVRERDGLEFLALININGEVTSRLLSGNRNPPELLHLSAKEAVCRLLNERYPAPPGFEWARLHCVRQNVRDLLQFFMDNPTEQTESQPLMEWLADIESERA